MTCQCKGGKFHSALFPNKEAQTLNKCWDSFFPQEWPQICYPKPNGESKKYNITGILNELSILYLCICMCRYNNNNHEEKNVVEWEKEDRSEIN